MPPNIANIIDVSYNNGMKDEHTSKINMNKNPISPIVAVILLNTLPFSMITQNSMLVNSPIKNPGNVPGVWLAPFANNASPADNNEDFMLSDDASSYFLDNSNIAKELLSAIKIV